MSKIGWEEVFASFDADIPQILLEKDLTFSDRSLKEFEENAVQIQIKARLFVSLKMVRDKLEALGPGTETPVEEVPYEMAFLQGQAYQLRLNLDLPVILADNRSVDQLKREEQKEE